MLRTLILAALGLMLAACQTLGMFQQHDQAELQAMRDAYDTGRTRTFDRVTPARALGAAKAIFQLADPDYEVALADNGLVAHRSWTALPGEGPGQAWWYVALWPSGSGVIMRVRLAPEPDPALAVDFAEGRADTLTAAVMDPLETTLNELADTDGAVGLFYMRMQWLLGRNAYWLYCSAGQEYAKIEHWKGPLDALCAQAEDVRADRTPLNLPR